MLMAAFRDLGVIPIAVICIYRLVTLALNARSWQLLLPPSERPGFPTLLRLRWIGESVNGLLPVAQVGGDVARASLVAARGVPRAQAAASMMADLWTGIITQVVFGIGGAIALMRVQRQGGAIWGKTTEILAGLALSTLPMVVLFSLYRFGAGRFMGRLAQKSQARGRLLRLAGGLGRLDQAMTSLLARERALASAFAWHLVGWVSQVGETWILLALMNASVSFGAALAIESMATAARGAAFFVPSGLGVQEVTIVSMSRLVGIPMEAAIALGIAKRARELLLGIPGLVAWVFDRKALRAMTKSKETDRGAEGEG
jgi:putative membrane protein